MSRATAARMPNSECRMSNCEVSPSQPCAPAFSRGALAALWGAVLLLAVALAAANIRLGELNQDEGWYLYAARLVSEGQVPYRDFAHTQPPVWSYVYALGQPLVDRWGLAGGRLFTALLGLAAALGGAWLAGRLALSGRKSAAALMAFALTAINVYQSYFCAVVKTYALGALFLVAGFLLLSADRERAGRVRALAAGIVFSLAAGTRISAGIVLPVVFVYLLLVRRERPGDWFRFAAGAAAASALIFLPFFLMAPEGFIFGVLQYHAARESGGFAAWAVYKAGFVSRVVQAYFVACALLVAAGLAMLFRLGRRGEAEPGRGVDERRSMLALLWSAGAAVTLVHFSAPVPYDDYQVMVFPLFAVALAAGVVRLAPNVTAVRWLTVTMLLVATGGAFASPINQNWFIRGRDRIWWRVREQSPLHTLQATARDVRALAPAANELLTQDLYLAVEARLRVPPGLELGPFSYYPDWDADRASVRHVLNRAMLADVLAHSPAPVAAFSGYGLTIRAPEISELPASEQRALQDLLARRYAPVRDVPGFGQGDTTLTIWRRRE